MGADAFPNLFSPLDIGPVRIRNRIVFGPHGVRLQDANLPNDALVAYHARRARGGAGLIVQEVVHAVPREAADSGPYMSVYKPGIVDAWARVVDAVHEHGCKILQQVTAAGLRPTVVGIRDPAPLLAPSAVPIWPGAEIPRPMDRRDIDDLVESFALTAEKIRAAGFDGIEIHAGHTYHLHLWLSPAFNKRTDEYGGDVAGRCRVPLAVMAAVREAAGPGMAVGMRVNADDLSPGGIDVDDAEAIARHLDRSGLVDYFSITAGVDWDSIIPPMYAPHGVHLDITERLTKAVDAPTMARGRIVAPEEAERVIADGKADMVTMVRALIADPDLPVKAREGRSARIRTCVGANDCLNRNQAYVPIGCIYNPEAGNELGWAQRAQPARSRRLVVVGGGPGGCEAARVAAERGHRVTLLERNERLGGQVLVACNAPGRADFAAIPRFYERVLAHLGVDVRLGFEATAEQLVAMDADVVIVATGSVAAAPSVPLDGVRAMSADAALRATDLWDDVVVYVEADHIAGLSAADRAASDGRRTVIYTPFESVGAGLDPATRQALKRRLNTAGVALHASWRLAGVEDGAVLFEHVGSAELRGLECSTLVYDCGAVPDRSMEIALQRVGAREVRAVGDCVTVRGVMRATRDGAVAGLSL